MSHYAYVTMFPNDIADEPPEAEHIVRIARDLPTSALPLTCNDPALCGLKATQGWYYVSRDHMPGDAPLCRACIDARIIACIDDTTNTLRTLREQIVPPIDQAEQSAPRINASEQLEAPNAVAMRVGYVRKMVEAGNPRVLADAHLDSVSINRQPGHPEHAPAVAAEPIETSNAELLASLRAIGHDRVIRNTRVHSVSFNCDTNEAEIVLEAVAPERTATYATDSDPVREQ